MENFIPFIDNRPTGGSGCNVENSGATVAVNDLLASVHGHGAAASLRLFPGGWPAGQRVSFRDIRVRGAFTVSATAIGAPGNTAELTAAVSVVSLAGNALTVHWPWSAAAPKVTSAGAAVPVEPAGSAGAGAWRFETGEGRTYELQ